MHMHVYFRYHTAAIIKNQYFTINVNAVKLILIKQNIFDKFTKFNGQ